MIERSYDSEKLIKATECCRDLLSIEDIYRVLLRPNNIMLVSGDDVGLIIYDYPGAYTVHWYYTSRGREAIKVGKQMISILFDDYRAQIIRGLIKTKMKASRWAARQVGLKSYGFLMFPDDDENEILIQTKQEYLQMKRN